MIWFAEFENTQCGKVKKDMLNTRTTLSLAGVSQGTIHQFDEEDDSDGLVS